MIQFFIRNLKPILIVFFISFVGLLCFIYDRKGEDHLNLNKKTCSAYIYKTTLTKRPVLPRIYYKLKCDNELYSNAEYFEDISNDIPYRNLVKLKGEYVLAIIDSTNPNVRRLLLTESDYKRYNISYPDSMKWLKEIIGE